LSQLNLHDNVVLLGEIPDVSMAIAASDAFLLVSAQEGVPNALLEAQWYGRPCLVADAGGTREAIREGVTGVVTKSNYAEEIAQELLQLLKDRELLASALR